VAPNTSQLDLFVPHAYHGQTIEQRGKDGYINATAMCQAAGKNWHDYFRLGSTQPFLQELAAETGIPASEIVESIRGGPPHRQGTWVHPQVAISLAQWLSPRFAVLVSKWVVDWMSGGGTPQAAKLPFHLRRYIDNQMNVPKGHFSVLNEITLGLIAPLEAQATHCLKSFGPISRKAACSLGGFAMSMESIRIRCRVTGTCSRMDGPPCRQERTPMNGWPSFENTLKRYGNRSGRSPTFKRKTLSR
jgi:hypothetical protein